MASSPPAKKMDTIIIGGSISGLMHGIMLRSLHHRVLILEQQASDRQDYGAGMGTGPQGKEFLSLFDPTPQPIGYDCPGLKILGLNNEVRALPPNPNYLTSWPALYYRLRGLYDGLQSSFCLEPSVGRDPDAKFETRKRVVGVEAAEDGKLVVKYEDLEDNVSKSLKTAYADLVIDASGPYSLVRSSLLPNVPKPRYSGFIAWRGTVPDTLVSEETNAVFDDRFNIFPMAGGSYCIGYAVPGKNGALKRGQRQLNWIWYTTVSDPAMLQEILTDSDGHTHSNTIPRGKLNLSVWLKHRDRILPSVSKAFTELMCATAEPFVSTIRESFLSQRSFFDGRLVIVGDGANLMRPTGGQSTNGAAMQCLALKEVLEGRMSMREWQVYVKEEGWTTKLFSNIVSERFLYGGFWGTLAEWHWKMWVRWVAFKRCVRRMAKL